jgi:S1-C subfamily serine protease
VVQKSTEPCEVRIYDGSGELLDEVEADLVARDEGKDLALLKLRTGRVYGTVARLASRASLRSVRVFTPLYAIGCPLGHDPLPTIGEVASLRKEVGGENFWMMTAPTIFGNSGGGVFHRETRELIGVSVMICTYDGAVSTPVPHLGILVSLETVYDWLDSLQYRFLYDPAFREEGSPASGGGR